jgi:hypothetical protein
MTFALAVGSASAAFAQQPDTTQRSDSAARADSIARDSIALVREMERIRNEPAGRVPPFPATGPNQPVQGPANPSLLPNISVIGDVVGDLSPDGATLEGGNRFGVREVELALQAVVDPFVRGDFILGISDLEGIAIEEAYLTTTSLPWGLQLRGGRFHMPVGKQNTTHRAELHTIEYPLAIQRFLGEEGLKGTGLWASEIFAPLGFYQELIVTAVDALGGSHGHEENEEPEPVTAEAANRRLSGLGYSARLRNYWDLSQATNLEVSASAATGKRPEHIVCFDAGDAEIECGDVSGVNARQSVAGVDVTLRWRPLQQGLYRSFILQAEAMRQFNESPELPAPAPPASRVEYEGPTRRFDGAYVFARYQLSRRFFLGGRYDWLEDPEAEGERLTAASTYLTFFPSEFSKVVAGFERQMPSGIGEDVNRILLQATFAIGPHRPHPF